jgi:hypothetical protein
VVPFAELTRRHEGGIMSRIVALVITAAAIAVAILAFTSPASGITRPQVFSLLEVEGPAWPLDPGATGERPPLGSRFAFTSAFYKWEGRRRGARVAYRDGVCTWIKVEVAAQSSTILCTGVFFLPAGQIYSTGMIRFAKNAQLPDVPVIGGTGGYANVRGFIKIREIGRGKANLEFHLTP